MKFKTFEAATTTTTATATTSATTTSASARKILYETTFNDKLFL